MLKILLRLSGWVFIAILLILFAVQALAPSQNVFAYMPVAPPDQVERDVMAYDTRTGISTRLVRDNSILNYDISLDGQWMVYASRIVGETRLTLLNIFTHEKRILLHADVYDPAFSPDGQWIAYRNNARKERGIWIMPFMGGEPTRIATLPRGFAWSPDSTQIMYADSTPTEAQNGVFSVNINTHEEQLLLNTDLFPTMMVWTDDAYILLNTYQLFHYDLATDAMVQMSRNNTFSAHPRLSPDGHYVIVAFNDRIQSGINMYDVSGVYQQGTTPPHIFIASTNPGGVSVGDAVDWWLQGE